MLLLLLLFFVCVCTRRWHDLLILISVVDGGRLLEVAGVPLPCRRQRFSWPRTVKPGPPRDTRPVVFGVRRRRFASASVKASGRRPKSEGVTVTQTYSLPPWAFTRIPPSPWQRRPLERRRTCDWNEKWNRVRTAACYSLVGALVRRERTHCPSSPRAPSGRSGRFFPGKPSFGFCCYGNRCSRWGLCWTQRRSEARENARRPPPSSDTGPPSFCFLGLGRPREGFNLPFSSFSFLTPSGLAYPCSAACVSPRVALVLRPPPIGSTSVRPRCADLIVLSWSTVFQLHALTNGAPFFFFF